MERLASEAYRQNPLHSREPRMSVVFVVAIAAWAVAQIILIIAKGI